MMLPLKLPYGVPAGVFAGTVMLVGWTYFNGELFGYHVTCMAAGFPFFMAEGILLSNHGVVLKPGPERLQLFQKHLALQLCGWLLIAAGFYAIYHNKDVHGKPHFMTRHATLGVSTIVLALLVTPALGAGAFKWLGIHEKLPESWQVPTKTFHRWSGGATFGLAVLTVLYGMATPGIYKELYTPTMQLMTLVCGGVVLNSYLLKGSPTGYSATGYTSVSSEVSMEPLNISRM